MRELFIKNAIKKYGDKYDYSLVEYKNNQTKVKIICPIHGVFEKRPKDFLNGQECKHCKKDKKKTDIKSTPIRTTQDFIKQAKTIHGDKYDYQLIDYKNSQTKVKIICPKHGIFEQTSISHIHNKHGCPKCKGGIKLTQKEFITRSKKIHNDKYDYSLVEYKNNQTKVKIICPIHGVFKQLPSSHIKGIGCKKCGYESSAQKRKGDLSNYIKLSKQLHNNAYSYPSNQDYSSIHNNIDIICPIHGLFKQNIANHLYNKTGCPKCKTNYSSQEEFIKQYLDTHQIKYIERDRKLISPLEVDFYIPEYNLAIECNGLYWHGELSGGKNRKYHLNKTELCKEKGIKLIHIYEDEILFTEKIITSKLNLLFSKNKRPLYARKCIIKEITPKIKTNFLKKYHLQGDCKSKYNLGLFYNNKLVSVMTFSNRRLGLGYQNMSDTEWELSRYCGNFNFYIIGGASKLLKYFERNYKPSKIITYADKRWSTGDLYFKLGFKHTHDSKPNYWYFDKHFRKRFYRFNFRKSLLAKKLSTFDPDKTEWQNMQDNGWDRIWDCGNMVFKKTY